MKKAIYKPTRQNIIITQEFDDYCEILLDGEYKTVSKDDIEYISNEINLSSIERLKENIFISCLNNPLNDILYSFNTNRLTPEPHQYKPLFKFLNSQNNRILIADEVGLGKTIEAGMIYKEIDKREELKISLIVVPSSLTHKWKEEFAIRFNEHFEIYKTNQFINFIEEYEKYSTSRFFNEKIIISYHTLRDKKVVNKLQNSLLEIDFLIIDEAHTMRNEETSTFKSGELITSLAEHIVFLTATPIQNYLSDLFNILSLLDMDYFKDYGYFTKMIQPNPIIHKLISLIRNNHQLNEIKEYINTLPITTYPPHLQQIISSISNLNTFTNSQKIEFIEELTKADHLSFIINRTKKKDVGLITPRSATSKIINLTKEEKEYYNAVIEFVVFLYPHLPPSFITIMPERLASSSMIASLESFKSFKSSNKLNFAQLEDLDQEEPQEITLQTEAIKYLDNIIKKGEAIGDTDSKLVELDKILQELHSQKIKQVIIFSFFKKTIKYLEEKLQNLNYNVGSIHGDLNTQDRFNKIKEFKQGKFDILLSTEVGSEGLDMQFCNVVINYDLPWNPMRVEQRIGKIDRIGQKFDKLLIFNLCIKDSIEDRIFNRLYTKLNLFESSIGEIEPILGNLEKELKIPELIKLSQDELDKKLKLQELAFERNKQDIAKHSQEFDKMLNEELNYKQTKEQALNQTKLNILQEQTKTILLEFLNSNNISYLELKDNSIKLSSQNLKSFLNTLKQNMSNKTQEPLKHKEEKRVLLQISKQKELKIKFNYTDNDDYQTLYLGLHSPILKIITKNKKHNLQYSIVANNQYKNSYAIIYRVDLKYTKSKSFLNVAILDKNYNLIDNLDYFNFINNCTPTNNKPTINYNTLKSRATPTIIKQAKILKHKEEIEQNRLIDIKIASIKSYFKKQIEKAKRLQNKVEQQDIIRMRIGEIENLQEQRDKKIQELHNQKTINSSFEILGLLEVVE